MIRRALVLTTALSALFACGPDTPQHTLPNGERPESGSAIGTPSDLHLGMDIRHGATALPEPLSLDVGPWRLPPVQTSLETYELQIPDAELQKFKADPFTPEQPATFTSGGKSYPVTVELRGASARDFDKKSWNVDFGAQEFDGRDKLKLVGEYQDQTMMAEKLAYDMLEAMRVPAPRAKYVRVVINGKYQGLYLDIEAVNKNFVRAHRMPDTDPSIYRAGSWDGETKPWKGAWQGDWEKKTNEAEPWDDLHEFLSVVNYTPEPQFPAALRSIFDVEHFLRFMALEAIMSNNYVEDARSYYISDRVTNRWYIVPWDLNNVDARFWPTYGLDTTPIYDHPLFSFTLQDKWLEHMYATRSPMTPGYEPTFDQLRTRILANPELRAELLDLTERARRELLDPSVVDPWIEATYAFIEPYVRLDPYMDQTRFHLGKPFLLGFISQRYDFVRDELQRLRTQQPGLVISAFDPAGGWIELENLGSSEASTSGLVLTTYLRRAVVPPNVPAVKLQPGEKVRFTVSQLGLSSFPAKGEVGLFDGKSVAGAIDFLYYGTLPPGEHYARDAQAAWQIE